MERKVFLASTKGSGMWSVSVGSHGLRVEQGKNVGAWLRDSNNGQGKWWTVGEIPEHIRKSCVALSDIALRNLERGN